MVRLMREHASVSIVVSVMRSPVRNPKLRIAALCLCLGTFVAGATAWCSLPDYRRALQEQRERSSSVVTDRRGEILRIFPDSAERYTLWCDRSTFPPFLKDAVVAAEDKRFFYHPGFDPIAILRALISNVARWRIVSGASTITQQVVRLIDPRPRTYTSKFIELAAAIKMDAQITKEEILELHLNLSPMGSGIRGAGLASRLYFGKDLRKISLPEAAVLAALPRSPTRYSPRKESGRKSLRMERDRILRHMASLGFISSEQLERGVNSGLKLTKFRFPLEAPHLVDLVLSDPAATRGAIRTTVDLQMQKALENVLRSHRARLRAVGIEQAGALIVSVPDAEVLATVGSFSYGPQDGGYNNAVLARRSAGSTLKPFLYALAIENGYHPFSQIPDTERSYPTPHGDYLPYNADRRSYGPVTIRSALGNSLNLSAVKMVRALGTGQFYRLLTSLSLAGDESLSEDHFGLGMAIGNIETSLYDLVQAYGALADGGRFRHLTTIPGRASNAGEVFSPETAYIITHILSDPTARILTFGNPYYFEFGFPVAVKTGTSNNFRDAWTVAYTSRHVIGIWAGNFMGRPGSSLPGATICGPILKDIVSMLYGGNPPAAFSRPRGVREAWICPESGKPAGPRCPRGVTELVAHAGKMETCTLSHETEYRYLGGSYARWIHRREARLGPGRFRLERTNDRSVGQWGTGEPSVLDAGLERGNIEIVSPHSADHFLINRHGPTQIVLRAVPQPVVSHVIWLIDGVELARTPAPYEFFWTPTRGKHVIHAVTPQRRAATATIYVD